MNESTAARIRAVVLFCIITLGCPCWSSLKCIMHKKIEMIYEQLIKT
ncbi:hypothetical protein DORFOR_00129 [Dorea formicigenerans ATCC 27755]|uniref:Uncharacterized protein n=1 Tax=Dorea formicigenerans ATCC 27755 TaxID=411461 RepID=B0G1N7_9FIRM|nr:hypothetical protein DORFOR_00129 [Dorea formicigenerans ATCC 27755]